MPSIFHKLAEDTVQPSENQSGKKSIFHSLAREKKQRTTLQDIEHLPEYIAEGGYGSIVGAPRTVTGALEFASKFPDQKRFISYALSKPEEFLKKIGFPTQEEATKQAKERTGTAEFEESPLQKGATVAGSILGGSALTPGASFGSAAKAGITGLAALGGGIGAGMEGGATGEIGGAIGLPALVTAMAALKTGKFSPSTNQLRQLYKEGKNLGLTDKELTPLLQTRFKKKLLSKFAARTERAENLLGKEGQIEGALGNLYEKLKTSSSKVKPASEAQEESLFHALSDITTDLRKSKFKSVDKESAIKKIEDLREDIIENGINAEEIISTWQEINSAVNWNSIRGGKKALAAVKQPLGELFKELSPQHYKEFETINKLWGNLKDISSKIDKSQYDKLLNLGKLGAFGKGLIDLVSHGNPKTLMYTAAGVIGHEGAKLLATEMLTNPRLNGLVKRTLSGLASNSKKTQMFYLNKFMDEIQKYPEIAKEIDLSSEDQESPSNPNKSP